MKNLVSVVGGALLVWSTGTLAFDSANFGSVPMAGSKLVHHTVVSPQGALPVWPRMTLAGLNADNFQIVNDTCSGVAWIDRCTLDVLFWPTSLGAKTAYLVNPWTNDPANPELLVNGTAIAANTGGLDSFVPYIGITYPQALVVHDVSVNGNADIFSLTVTQNIDSNSIGQWGGIFLGAYVPPYANDSGLSSGGIFQPTPSAIGTSTQAGTWYLNDGALWRKYEGEHFSANKIGPLNNFNATTNVLSNADPASLCGTEFYIGYGIGSGTNDTQGRDMKARDTFGKFYKVMCNFDFHGYYSGPLSKFNLSAYVQVATAETGQAGVFYVGRIEDGYRWYFHNGIEWKEYHDGPIPTYNTTDALMSRMVQIYTNEDASVLTHSEVYVGYGRSIEDMLDNRKYGRVYP